ncbi:MAG: sulfite exporter TauE/SafE family protein [Chloroflexi bacterium]|nr:sulfite exporter TauE/SafE family protein [Chloroflexota bacterium]
MEIEVILIIATVGLLIGLAKGGFGPVAGALATPLLSQVMPVPQAVATALPLLMIGDVFALGTYWRRWDIHHIRLLVPAAVIGVFAGAYLLTTLPDHILRPALGLFTLTIVIYKIVSVRLTAANYHLHNWHGYLAGVTSGFSSAVANAGGPPFTAYMLLQNVSPTVFIGTTTLFFSVTNLIKLPSFIVAGLMDDTPLLVVLAVIPLVLTGVWLGKRFIKWVDPKVFENVMLVLLVVACLLLFVKPG